MFVLIWEYAYIFRFIAGVYKRQHTKSKRQYTGTVEGFAELDDRSDSNFALMFQNREIKTLGRRCCQMMSNAV